jgi:hypothetical protein
MRGIAADPSRPLLPHLAIRARARGCRRKQGGQRAVLLRSLLHDYGIVSPTANRDFTLGSVDRMLACVDAAAVDDERADLLADGICVHTTPGVKVETDGTIGCYLQWGAMVDGAGLRIWDIAPGNLEEVLRRYPRGDFKRELVAMLRAEAAAVPGGRFGLLLRCGLPLAVRLAPFAS